MIVGDSLEDWPKDGTTMGQFHSVMNSWSSVDILLTIGNFNNIFQIQIIRILSPLETEIWNFVNESNTVIDPTIPSSYYSTGIGLYIVPFDFCAK